MIVVIGVNIVVYEVCKCAKRFNPSPIHIMGLVPQNSGRVYVNLIFVECILVLPKFRGFHKIAIYRVRVNFVKI